MLTPEQAKERLEAQRDLAALTTRKNSVAKLPSMQRAIGEAILDPRGRFGGIPEAVRKAVAEFDDGSVKERRRLFASLFPQLADDLERWWQVGKAQPYQEGWSRRAFRAPKNPMRSRKRRFGELASLTVSLGAYEPDPVWIARWAPHLGWGTALGSFLAAVIDGGGDQGAAVFDTLVACANGEDEIGQMDRNVVAALLGSEREDGWELIERTLIAAQRQEGLRQVILETVDLARPAAFRRMLSLILEQGLTRFTAAARATDVWFGFDFAAGDLRRLDSLLERTTAYLDDQAARDAALRTGSGEDAYLAMWCVAFEDAFAALPIAETLLADPDPERRYAAAHLLAEVNIGYATRALILALRDDDLRVVQRALRAFEWQSLAHFDAEGQRRLVDELERLLNQLEPSKRELKPLLWPWTGGTFDPATVAALLVRHGDAEPVHRFVPHVPRMDSNTRLQFAVRLEKAEPRAELREVALTLVGDPSASVREVAIKAMGKLPVSDAETLELEGLLRRKAEDLRRGVAALLLNRKDKQVFASVDRLFAGDGQQRLGGLELLRRLTEADRSVEEARARATGFSPKGGPSAAEQLQLDAIVSTRAEEIASLDRRLGLVEATKLTPALTPKDRKVGLVTRAAVELLRELDELVHGHRDDRITIEDWQGQTREELLGNVSHWFPGPWRFRRGSGTERTDASRLPLADLWLEWWDAQRPMATRDADSFEAGRAAAAVSLLRSDPAGRFVGGSDRVDRLEAARKEMVGKLKLPSLRYPHIVPRLIDWLLVLRPVNGLDSYLLAAAETLLARVPRKELEQPPPARNEWWLHGTWRDRGWLSFQNVIQMRAHAEPNALAREQWVRLWRLGLWVRDPLAARDGGKGTVAGQSLDFVALAQEHGAASDDDVIDFLLDTPATTYAWEVGHRSLHEVSGRWTSGYPGLIPIVDRIRRRVIEIELQRGEAPTPASAPARALRYSGGLETLAPVLRRLGKQPLVRGWTYDSASTKNIFSHLIRTSFPGEADTGEAFASAMVDAGIPEKRLVELATFAPQWSRHVEHAVGWEGLASAVWWLHAHTKDTSWTVEQEIRDAWAAEVSERTPLSSDDLVNGAVDVDWFHDVYALVGAKRWSVIDAAAKYCSTGGGHKRAQLFADAMLKRVSESELGKRIKDKRHQDAVRALGLLPLPDGAKREETILGRYRILQEFLRTSRQFGSQRQQSEKRAVEIGMANLARTAGYRDPLRLSWAMEARGIADLADGPLTEEVEGVHFALTVDDEGTPDLTVSRDGKALKAVPAKLRSRKEVKALRARVTELRRQGSRVRGSLEDAMVRGDSFSGDELHELSRHLVLYPRLQRLVLLGDGTAGYPAADGRVLIDHAGAEHAIGREEQLRIAHPLDLLSLADWHDWQRDCLARQVIQPFKQVFRELYVPTPDERGATVSRRYAGSQLQPRQAVALLSGRGWVVHPEEGVRKTFHREGISVALWFLEAFFTPAELEGLTLEEVQFFPVDGRDPLMIDGLPQRLFSEVMRDLDLVVSVAHAGGVDPETSSSTVEMRSALVQETAELLSVANVRIDEPWVLIDGKLGDWSVHLGSANVHRRPGGAVCIVPVHAQHRGRIFLPFADDDPKTAEVMAKVLLLANDQEIKDPTILEQLRG